MRTRRDFCEVHMKRYKTKNQRIQIEYSIATLNDLQMDNRLLGALQYRLEHAGQIVEKLTDEEAQTLLQSQYGVQCGAMVTAVLMTPGELRDFFINNPAGRQPLIEDLLRKALQYRPEAERISVRQCFESIRTTDVEAVVN